MEKRADDFVDPTSPTKSDGGGSKPPVSPSNKSEGSSASSTPKEDENDLERILRVNEDQSTVFNSFVKPVAEKGKTIAQGITSSLEWAQNNQYDALCIATQTAGQAVIVTSATVSAWAAKKAELRAQASDKKTLESTKQLREVEKELLKAQKVAENAKKKLESAEKKLAAYENKGASKQIPDAQPTKQKPPLSTPEDLGTGESSVGEG